MKLSKTILGLALLATALSGCAGSASRVEPKRLLLAYDGPAAASSASPRPRLVLRAIAIPDYLDRRELVQRVSGSEVVRDKTAVWAERPAKSITRWITLALGAQRADYAVESYTTADGRAPDALLAIDLEGFAQGADNTLRLRGSWIYAPNGSKATHSGRFDADALVAAGGSEATVVALQTALQSAVQALSTQLPKAAFAVPPPR